MGGVEQRVRGQGAYNAQALELQLRHGGRDDFQILAANRATFSGMWVQPGNRKLRIGYPEPNAQIVRDDARCLDDQFPGEQARHILDGHVNRHRNGPQAAMREHHYRKPWRSALRT
jgi:hypothetical protein